MITEDSRYSGMSDGEWHRMGIRGSCEWFRYSLFEASKTERPKARGGAPSQTPLYSNGYQSGYHFSKCWKESKIVIVNRKKG